MRRALSSAGRASRLHREGREFEPLSAHQSETIRKGGFFRKKRGSNSLGSSSGSVSVAEGATLSRCGHSVCNAHFASLPLAHELTNSCLSLKISPPEIFSASSLSAPTNQKPSGRVVFFVRGEVRENLFFCLNYGLWVKIVIYICEFFC